MTFINSIQGILTIMVLIMVGWFLRHKGWLTDDASKLFSKLILNLSLPCFMLYHITTTFEQSELKSLSRDLTIPFVSIILSYLLAIVVSNIIRVDRNRKGLFRTMFFASNTMFIGLPVNLSLFGEDSIPYVLLYYLANTCCFWTIGAYEVSRDNPENRGVSVLNPKTLKRILNPAVIGFVAGVLLVFSGIKLPPFITDSCKYIGNLTTPLAMFFTGIVLHSVKISELRPNKDMVTLLLARSVICPALVLLLIPVFPVPKLMGMVFVIQAAMPTITSTSVLAREYGSDYQFATVMTTVTTAASLIAIPFYMWFMQYL